MQNPQPLNKVVFIQKVATFTKIKSIKDLCQLAYVNNSWNDTINNYSCHLFERQVCDMESVDVPLETVCGRVIRSGVAWLVEALLLTRWKIIEPAFYEIFYRQPISANFRVLHKNLFTLATLSPQYKYDQLREFLRTLVSSQRDNHVFPAVADGGSAVLACLAAEYEKFSDAILKYSHLCLHLDRHWCPGQRLNGVVSLGCDIFGQVMLKNHPGDEDPRSAVICAAVSSGFVKAIRREHGECEEAADHNLLKNICGMLLEVGHQSTLLNRLVVDPFLRESTQFFEAEASRLLSSSAVPLL